MLANKYVKDNELINKFVLLFVIIFFLNIPLTILSQGYMPNDDVKRHAAKIISDKNWKDVLVLDEQHQDKIEYYHIGWHKILDVVNLFAGGKQDPNNVGALVFFSIIFFFWLIFCFFSFVFKRPEIWVGSVMVFIVFFPSMIHRFIRGRPFLMTTFSMMLIAFLWGKIAEDKENKSFFKPLAIITAVIALSTWMHGAWYLFGIFFIALI